MQTARLIARSFLCTLSRLDQVLVKCLDFQVLFFLLVGCKLDSTPVRGDLRMPPLQEEHFGSNLLIRLSSNAQVSSEQNKEPGLVLPAPFCLRYVHVLFYEVLPKCRCQHPGDLNMLSPVGHRLERWPANLRSRHVHLFPREQLEREGCSAFRRFHHGTKFYRSTEHSFLY